MSDTAAALVAIAKGDRVRVGGTSYDATEDATLHGTFVPGRQQVNRHLSVICTNPDCTSRAKSAGLKPWAVRASRAMFLRGLPRCGECDGIWADGSLHTCAPDGWALDELPADGDDN